MSVDRIQARLLALAALFLGLYALVLTLSPAARARSWSEPLRWEHWLGYLAWIMAFVLAHRLTGRYLPNRDPFLLPVAALLSGWGLMTIWRLLPAFGMRQAIWLGLSIGLILVGLRLPHDLSFLRRYKYVWLFGGLGLTALTLLFGTNPATGSSPRLWLGCCGFYFQPSEPLKLMLVIYLAAYLADRQTLLGLAPSPPAMDELDPGASQPSPAPRPSLWPLLLPTLFMTGLTVLLLLVQRDLGTAAIFVLLFSIIIYLATDRTLILAISAGTLILAAAIGYFLFEVLRLRVDAWLNPWLDPSGRSYQIVQSLVAVANGGLFGRGPGLGNPGLVPVAHSDFIFTAILEESGLLGAIGLIALFTLLVASGLRVALRAPDMYRRYLAAGLTTYLVGQMVLIAGGNLRLMPLTGVTLPFVSYGGSSLLTAYFSLLILLIIGDVAESRQGFTPNPRPYRYLGGFLLAGLFAVALTAGWWAYWRGPDLLTRTDNPRRAIADRFVRRGAILDRHNNPLNTTEGSPGDFERQYRYPPLAATLGYSHPAYGQSGLEASLDPYLRGLRGNPALSIWWDHLLYGQPPPGLDVRLSIDLDLQKAADDLLDEDAGAAVLVNARTGEILALASHPAFDPNQLDEDWQSLVTDPETPLFNRAVLGSYPIGSALGPFLLASAVTDGDLLAQPQQLGYSLDGLSLRCARQSQEWTWATAVAAGCPGPVIELGELLGAERVSKLYQDLGFFNPPAPDLEVGAIATPQTPRESGDAVLGFSDIRLSPLQMALAAAALSSGGTTPEGWLATGTRRPDENWETLPAPTVSSQPFASGVAQSVTNSLAIQGPPVWQSLAVAPDHPGQTNTWYLGGTLPSWSGAPLAVAVLLEEENPDRAESIGQNLLNAALNAE
jgi:cell division protein FtsW (lipid II flippase)